MKKGLAVIAVMVVLVVGGLFIYTGFCTRTDVGLIGYSVSEDSSTLTMQTGVFTSMGYTRAVKTRQEGNAVYCSFYSAFGGLNSSIGARNTFQIALDDTCQEIYFDRGQAGPYLVLYKEESTGEWVSTYDMR